MGDISALDTKSLFRMIALDPSYSGKNHLCLHVFIQKNSSQLFAHLTAIACNPHQELHDYLRVDQVRKGPQSSIKPELLIIDVYSNDKLLLKNVFSHHISRGRHFKLSAVFLSHSYFAVDKMLRLNSEYKAILKANSKRDLTMVLKDLKLSGVASDLSVLIGSVRDQLRYNLDRPIRTDE
ncbi:uncharacterized protein PITG_17101 [Phytophthora infestans T30-4]|uniref:Uncharacterized protein n=1 Tax=Phytophthora infestans (strain T30-4) TaxID=403677 RepID=D0NV12_PHYIT|nr:uncharacterized protein PITG_17101 [Phytophthora infestans T30-4]EEY66484.1 conserved hypothetical protein [Phytophthora infestans T30-4]|eukprot:XP_002897003.1 conserved hypothetical protein [Phytophthora infestans T30-4]